MQPAIAPPFWIVEINVLKLLMCWQSRDCAVNFQLSYGEFEAWKCTSEGHKLRAIDPKEALKVYINVTHSRSLKLTRKPAGETRWNMYIGCSSQAERVQALKKSWEYKQHEKNGKTIRNTEKLSRKGEQRQPPGIMAVKSAWKKRNKLKKSAKYFT